MALSLRHQLERCRVDAITQPCWRRPVGKYMAQVSIALGTFDFDAVHAVIEVIQAGDGLAVDGLEVTRPTAARVVLGVRIKQLSLAAGAVVNTWHLAVVVLAGKRALGAAQATDMKLLLGKLFAPGFQGFFQLVHRQVSSIEKSPTSTFAKVGLPRIIRPQSVTGVTTCQGSSDRVFLQGNSAADRKSV